MELEEDEEDKINERKESLLATIELANSYLLSEELKELSKNSKYFKKGMAEKTSILKVDNKFLKVDDLKINAYVWEDVKIDDEIKEGILRKIQDLEYDDYDDGEFSISKAMTVFTIANFINTMCIDKNFKEIKCEIANKVADFDFVDLMIVLGQCANFPFFEDEDFCNIITEKIKNFSEEELYYYLVSIKYDEDKDNYDRANDDIYDEIYDDEELDNLEVCGDEYLYNEDEYDENENENENEYEYDKEDINLNNKKAGWNIVLKNKNLKDIEFNELKLLFLKKNIFNLRGIDKVENLWEFRKENIRKKLIGIINDDNKNEIKETINNSEEYKEYLECLKSINAFEFVLYLRSGPIDNLISSEEEVLKEKIEHLSDKALRMIALKYTNTNSFKPNFFLKDKLLERNIIKITEEGYLEVCGTKEEIESAQEINQYYSKILYENMVYGTIPIEIIRENEAIENYINIFDENELSEEIIQNYTYIRNRVEKELKTISNIKAINYCDDKLLINFINKLDFLESYKNNFRDSFFINYFNKRIINMKSGFSSFFYIKENGAFNKAIQICAEQGEFEIKNIDTINDERN